jgi:type 1 glutamine amidotransferase
MKRMQVPTFSLLVALAFVAGCSETGQPAPAGASGSSGSSGSGSTGSSGSGSSGSGSTGSSGSGSTGSSGSGSTGSSGSGSTTGSEDAGASTTSPASEGGAGDSGASADAYAGPFRILMLSTTLGYHHDSIPTCQDLVRTLGTTPDAMMPQGTKPGSQFTVDIAKDDLSDFTDANLSRYGMLFFCSPTGTVFSSAGTKGVIGMAAFQKFIEESGRAWGGVHSATDFEQDGGFPWYTNVLLGGKFDHHDNDGTLGTVDVQTQYATQAVVRGVSAVWATQDEWYYMNTDINALPDFQVLSKLAVDGRPVVWIKQLGASKNGRMFYTIRGHNQTVYAEPDFKRLLLNGILWATHRLD